MEVKNGIQKKLAESVNASLRKAEEIVEGYKKSNYRLMITSIVSSAASTLVAGVTAAAGPVADIGVSGWRLACIIAAILGFISTVSTGISQQLKTNERLAQGKQCVGRLRYLEVVITRESKSWEEIGREYEDIVKSFPELI